MGWMDRMDGMDESWLDRAEVACCVERAGLVGGAFGEEVDRCGGKVGVRLWISHGFWFLDGMDFS